MIHSNEYNSNTKNDPSTNGSDRQRHIDPKTLVHKDFDTDSKGVGANKPSSQEASADNSNHENVALNRFFIFLTIFSYIVTALMAFKINSFWNDKILSKPKEYQLPSLYDFKKLVVYLPCIIAMKLLFEYLFQPLMYKILQNKYKVNDDPEMIKLGNIYKKKLATNLFKVTYYTGAMILGHFILKDLKFFPYELCGNGDMRNLFEGGFPNYLFFEKSSLFNDYYLVSLSFVIADFIWLIFIYDIQSDFYLMFLHHSTTTSLVVFSYLSNHSQIGVIVFYLHDITDIFVYLTRIFINTNTRDLIKVSTAALLLLSYIYLRLYVFTKLILFVYFNITWNIFSIVLWSLMCVLLTMHIYWVCAIIRRFYIYATKSSIEDVGKVKKK